MQQLELPREVLQDVDRRGKNLAIFDEENTLVPFTLATSGVERLDGTTLTVVEQTFGDGQDPQYLVDGDISTIAGFANRSDESLVPSVTLAFPRPVPLAAVSFDPSYKAAIPRLVLRAGLTRESMKTLYSGEYHPEILQETDPISYLEVQFPAASDLVLKDIFVYAAPRWGLRFPAEDGKRYTLAYGGSRDYAAYRHRETFSDTFTPNARLSNPITTADYTGEIPQYLPDTDRDGVANAEDNCPLMANEAQDDSDRDGIGDVCDSQDNRQSVGETLREAGSALTNSNATALYLVLAALLIGIIVFALHHRKRR
ncbi:thrombospondin type 3 repeat-containing protein [Candidatus Peribacteria bacterium]|nr:thrombospondin type 3 repeat-containing protein [Candidatus Peribacteria bacterium]